VVIGLVWFQRKDWINSDGKTVKPHNLEENPEYGKKQGIDRKEREKKDVRTSDEIDR
jgi:hypothetical protein